MVTCGSTRQGKESEVEEKTIIKRMFSEGKWNCYLSYSGENFHGHNSKISQKDLNKKGNIWSNRENKMWRNLLASTEKGIFLEENKKEQVDERKKGIFL